MPVANPVRRRLGPTCAHTCSSTPSAVTGSSRAGSFTSGSPCSRTARITVCQPTPSCRATEATVSACAPTRRIAHARARSVSTARDRIAGCVSDQVRCWHNGSWQRHNRFAHTNTLGRPAIGRSRTVTGRRPCGSATTPHRGQPVTDSVVSTSTSTSPATSTALSTTNPSSPSNATLGAPIVFPSTRGLLDLRTWSSQILRPRALPQAEADERVVTRSHPSR